MWVDLEMTGLDPAHDVIVELAVVITDGTLEREEDGPDVVIHQPAEALATMAPVVSEMHARSGLTELVAASTVTVAEAEAEALDFVRRHVPDAGTAPLAGNSVHSDRAFLRRYMPDLEAYLHYRIVDVSTVKELARRWYPAELEAAPKKEGGHRALADIRESIGELRHFRGTIFRSPLEQP